MQSVAINSGNEEGQINKDWYNEAAKEIRNEEYNITYDDQTGNYQSPNRANNIRFIYHNDGFTAMTRTNKIPLFDVSDKSIEEKDKKYETIDEWSIKFKVESEKLNVESGELQVADNRAYIENENIRIDYTNYKEGMRQDFIIKNRPVVEGKLRLNLSADTKLRIITGADALMFKDSKGSEKMKYSALKAWDANGKELRVYFEKNDKLQIKNQETQIPNRNKFNIKDLKSKIKTNSNSFTIVVNDENAIYPITIDPLSTSPSWTAEGNQDNAHFGISVSTAGDVNGDGYSDVIVGAERFDNGEADEGRSYVYYGSATGLSLTPNWIAEGNQIDAIFGNNVSTAGDVNGDGYSDVIIGAPLYDNEETDEGKAFVYYGSASGLSLTPNWTAEGNRLMLYSHIRFQQQVMSMVTVIRM